MEGWVGFIMEVKLFFVVPIVGCLCVGSFGVIMMMVWSQILMMF